MQDKSRWHLIAIILISTLLRVLAALYLGNQVEVMPGTADQLSYHTLAQRVLNGHGFTFGEYWWPITAPDAPTAHWSFLYTGFLVIVYSLFGVNPLVARLIQSILVGVLQPLLAYWIGRRIFGQTAGLAAALLTAVYAYFVYYAANLMTESFYITFILAGFYIAFELVDKQKEQMGHKRNVLLAVALGLSLGAAVLLRQLFLLFVPFLFLWLLLDGKRQLKYLMITSVVILGVILPFTIYNYQRFDRFVLLNTNAGYAFYWGNHPIYGTSFESILPPEMSSYGELIPNELRDLDEAALDQALLRRGIQFILDDPGRYVLLSISRIKPYFMFWPSPDSSTISNISRVASFGILWPFMLYGLWISLRDFRVSSSVRFPKAALLLWVFSIVYTLIHVLTWTLIRYRLPVDAVLIVFAGVALANLAMRIPFLRQSLDPVS